MPNENTTTASTEGAATGEDATTNDQSTVLTGDDTNSDTDATASDDGSASTGGDTDQSGDTGNEGDQGSTDTYADFAVPDGMTVDESMLADALPIFKDLGLTQEQAQKLVDFQAAQVQASSQKQVDTFNQLMTEWRTNSENDTEFGGDNFDKNVKIAQNAIGKFGTPELKQLLEEHGVGNHPEVIRFMVRVGKTLEEDVPGSTGTAASQSQDRVSILYPNSK